METQPYVRCRPLLSDKAYAFLRSDERFERFVALCNAEPGWDGRDAKSIQIASIVSFNLFCEHVSHMTLEQEPALCLNADGCLEAFQEQGELSVYIRFIDARTVEVWKSDETEDGQPVAITRQALEESLGSRNFVEFQQ